MCEGILIGLSTVCPGEEKQAERLMKEAWFKVTHGQDENMERCGVSVSGKWDKWMDEISLASPP